MNKQWEKFNLWKINLDQWWYILYSMRYSTEAIKVKRERIIQILEWLQIEPKEIEWDKYWIIMHTESFKTDINKIFALIEELSILNWALEYKELWEDIRSIEELKNILVTIYYSLMAKGDIVRLYNYIDIYVWEIIADILLADNQNKVLGAKDKIALDNLIDFRERQLKALNSPGWIMVIG